MLPNMAEVLLEWEVPVTLKTVTKVTVDFVEQNSVIVIPISAVVQPAEMDKLNPDTIDWSRRYLQIHSRVELKNGQFIEYEGEDYKITADKEYMKYGYSEVVGEQTKKPLLVASP